MLILYFSEKVKQNKPSFHFVKHPNPSVGRFSLYVLKKLNPFFLFKVFASFFLSFIVSFLCLIFCWPHVLRLEQKIVNYMSSLHSKQVKSDSSPRISLHLVQEYQLTSWGFCSVKLLCICSDQRTGSGEHCLNLGGYWVVVGSGGM